MKYLSLLFISISISLSAKEITSNPTILYIGDSHSYGKLGTTVEKNLLKISDHVIMESSCGSSAYTWLGKTGYEKTVCGFWKKDGKDEVRSVEHQTPKFSDEVIKYQPKVVIIQLGTNMAAAEKPSNSAGSIEQLMIEATKEGATCLWIGPPDANSKIVTKAKLQEVNLLLKAKAALNNCFYIDSLELTTFPKDSKEGIHYPPTASAEWGEKVSAKIVEYLESIEP
jgi:hypothetical protein